jgi:DNA repair protein RadC
MEQSVYERPREKVRNRGISSLSLPELLQLVISTGGPKHSSASLARHIEGIILRDSLTYDALIAIPGLGDAKACQILAVFEIAKRAYGHE